MNAGFRPRVFFEDNDMATTVWAFQPLDELKGATGFVECDDEMAALLIAAGKAQDPRDGGLAMKEITNTPPMATPQAPAEYSDKEVLPKRRR